MKNFIYIFFLLVLATSCKKEVGDFDINGLIINASDGQPMKSTEIFVQKIVSGTNEPVIVGTFTSDDQGHYSFKVKRDRFDFLILTVNPVNFFPIEEKLYFIDLSLEKANVLNLVTKAKAWAKIRLKSNSPSNSLNIIKKEGKNDCQACCPQGYQNFSGVFDTTFYCINDGNSNYKFTYFINGGLSSGVKEGITPSFDTLALELNF